MQQLGRVASRCTPRHRHASWRPSLLAMLGIRFTIGLTLANGLALAQEHSSQELAARELVRRGSLDQENGRIARAMKRYHEATVIAPGYGPAYLEQAKLRLRTGDRTEALRLLQGAQRDSRTREQALVILAELAETEGRISAAIAHLQRATWNSNHAAHWGKLAELYVQLKAFDGALVAWRRLRYLALRRGDARAAAHASLTVLALQMLVNSADPVTSIDRADGWTRRSLKQLAQAQ